MSEDRTDYVFYGFDAGYDNLDYDEWEGLIESQGNEHFDLIYDGMNGDFAFVGKIIARSDEYEGFARQKIDNPAGVGDIVREVKRVFPDAPTFEFHVFTLHS